MSMIASKDTKQDDYKIEEFDESKVLLESYVYTVSNGGKQVRSHLVDAFNVWLKLDLGQISQVKEIGEALHCSSLMIDDIEDDTKVRRGQPSAFVKFGLPLTINAANMVYFVALEKVLKLNNPRATQIFSEEMINLHKGQGMDIYWREKVECPTMNQYKRTISNKTGGLFRLIIGIMQALVGNTTPEIVELIEALGLYFQVRDDLINLVSEEYMKTRGTFADDLTEGKFSLPIIHAILFGKCGEELKDILRKKSSDDDVKRRAIQIMEESGSLEYTRKELATLEKKIEELIPKLGANPAMEKLYAMLKKY